GFCGKPQYVNGPFVLGHELNRSVQRALEHHWNEWIAAGADHVCANRNGWKDDEWRVVEYRGHAPIAAGSFVMTEEGPVVDRAISEKIDGLDWNARRVQAIGREEMPGRREWHVQKDG